MAESNRDKIDLKECLADCPAVRAGLNDTRCWALWDKALALMLHREETLLGDMVQQVKDLADIAEEQALDMVDFIEEST